MIKRWLRWLWANQDGFFGIGQGPSGAEKTQFDLEALLANFATGQGEGDILASDNFWKAILSGDESKIAQVLGPQFSGINKRAQEKIKTASEFGNRSGGTNAAMQMAGDETRSEIDNLIAGFTGEAAGQLGSHGMGLLGIGSSAHGEAFSMAKVLHDQRLAKMNDIFKSIAEVAGGVAGGFGGGASMPFAGMTGGEISGAFGGPTEATPSISDTGEWTVS